MARKSRKVSVAFSLDYDQAERLDLLAERMRLPKSVLVRDAINRLFEQYTKDLGEESPAAMVAEPQKVRYRGGRRER